MFAKYFTPKFDDELEWFHNGYYMPVIYPVPRRIAGSKRVERYQLKHGKGSENGRLCQSITAHPALSTQSFEVCSYFLNCLLLV